MNDYEIKLRAMEFAVRASAGRHITADELVYDAEKIAAFVFGRTAPQRGPNTDGVEAIEQTADISPQQLDRIVQRGIERGWKSE